MAQRDQLGAAKIQRIESRNTRSALPSRIGIVDREVVDEIISRKRAPAIRVGVEPETALVIPQNLRLTTGRKCARPSVWKWYVLKQVLRGQSELFVGNLAEKMLTYALGRGLESYDAPAVDGIMKELASNQYRLSSLVFAIVKSEPFQMRAGADAERTTKGSRGTNGAI